MCEHLGVRFNECMFKVSDIGKKPEKKEARRHTLYMPKELKDLIKEFARKHGKHETAEVLRRSVRSGLVYADKKMKA